MGKIYNSKWPVKKLIVNFNEKQWRQDFGEFVRQKLYWSGRTMVTRSRAKGKNVSIFSKGVKSFEVHNGYGENVIVEYQNQNQVLHTNREDLVNQYFKERGFDLNE